MDGQKMDSSVAIASILSLLSAVLVAVLSHFFSSYRQRRDELAEMRLKAYTDFINAASRLVSARRSGRTEDALDDLAALNDAKTRICVCAEAKVVEALIEFWNAGGTLEGEHEVVAFTRLCRYIRESVGNKRYDLRDLPISKTLFKLEPSNFSFRMRKGIH